MGNGDAANDNSNGDLRAITRERRETPAWLNGVFACAFLYLFLAAINVMGAGLKTIGHETTALRDLLAHGETNPLIALFGSVLITAIVQSSSFTTALIITLVAEDQMTIQTAVYAVMGANIGTSVTNIIVSLGNVRIRRQFRRAFTAALVHDIFNWLTVAVLFPIEWLTSAFHSKGYGVLARFAIWLSDQLGLAETEKPGNPIKTITEPVVNAVEGGAQAVASHATTSGSMVAVAGLLMLFFALAFMVKNLKGALLRHIENLFRKVFFRNDGLAYTVGALTTVLVQSSSVTTSLIVPLAGAGAVKLKRVYPYTLGANLGTTITGVIAATAKPELFAVAVAISHVSFNLIGTAIWYPLRRVPLSIARWYGDVAANAKRYAFLFLLFVFIIGPAVAIAATELILYLTRLGN